MHDLLLCNRLYASFGYVWSWPATLQISIAVIYGGSFRIPFSGTKSTQFKNWS